MRHFFLLILLIPGFLFADISDLVARSELTVYFPSYSQAVGLTRDVIQKFYGKNAAQMQAQMSLESKSGYGLDILDAKSLKKIGLNPEGPLAYVHIGDDKGYLLLSVSSKSKFKAYVRDVLGGGLPYRFEGSFALLSESESHLDAVTNLLKDTRGFEMAAKKLGFNWDAPFVWMESSYLGKISSSAGMSDRVKIPYGFSGLTFVIKKNHYLIRAYSALLSDRQVRFMNLMKQADGMGKFELFDYVGGHPALMAQVYLNLSLIYRYYRFIDRLGVLGVTPLLESLKKDYGVYVERDLIHNADGRFKLLVDTFSPDKGNVKLLGSIGVRNPAITKTLIDSLAAAVLKKEDHLYSFELFTHPFYHYQAGKLSFYYGLVENDFIFGTDKDALSELVSNIYSKKNGFLKNYPPFFAKAVEDHQKGAFASFDVQSILSGVQLSGFDITSDFLVGIRNVSVRTLPDDGKNAYGWNTDVDIEFYSQK